MRIAGAAAVLLLLAGPAGAQEPREPLELGELQVSVGSRATDRVARLSRSVEVLGRDELGALPVGTVQEALTWALGVDVRSRSPAQADLSIRGSGFEEVLVLVDGVRVSDAQTGHFDLNVPIPLDQVERIEVLRGPASALYGADAVGGVVNIVTRSTSPVAVRAAAGSFGRRTLAGQGGGETGAFQWTAAGEHDRADGHRPGTDHERTAARLRGAVRAGPGRVALDLSHDRRAFGARGFYAPYDSFERTRTTLGVLRWRPDPTGTGRVAPALESWIRVHDDDFVLRRDDPAFYRNQHRSVQYGASLSVRELPVGPFGAGMAVEAERNALESTSLGDRGQERAAVAGELALETGPVLMNAGLRLDLYDAFPGQLSPTASAAVGAPGWPIRLRAAYGEAFRVPTWTERYYRDPLNIADPDLRPERSRSVEAGLELFPYRAYGAELTAFRRVSRDLIDWARPADAAADIPWVTRNVERATFDGLELTAGAVVAGARVGVEALWLAVDATTAPGLASKYALRPMTRSLAATGRGSLAGFTLAGRVASERRRGEEDRTRVDLRVARGWGAWAVRVDLTNLGDARYLDIAGEPAPGRAVEVGVAWRLSPPPASP